MYLCFKQLETKDLCTDIEFLTTFSMQQAVAAGAQIESYLFFPTDAAQPCRDQGFENKNARHHRHIRNFVSSPLFTQSAPNLSKLPIHQSSAARRHSVHENPANTLASHTIFPRRKAGDGIFFSSPQPIVVTLDTLQTLKGLSLGVAAEKLGISPTAFKRACRALGMRRWAYQRGSDRASARALRRMTNAAHRAAAISAHGSFKAEARSEEADFFSWIVPPILGPLGEIELCSEEEALTGPAVFDWPRYG